MERDTGPKFPGVENILAMVWYSRDGQWGMNVTLFDDVTEQNKFVLTWAKCLQKMALEMERGVLTGTFETYEDWRRGEGDQ